MKLMKHATSYNYYHYFDPIMQLVVLLFSVGALIYTYVEKTTDMTAYRVIIYVNLFHNIMLLACNFRYAHENYLARKGFLYRIVKFFNTKVNPENFSWIVAIFAYMAYTLTLATLVLGLVIIILTASNTEDISRHNMNVYMYFYGVLTVIAGLVGLTRLPLKYLLSSMFLSWLFRGRSSSMSIVMIK